MLRIPSLHKLHLIVYMLNEKMITFEDQQIYKNKLAFKRAMHELHDRGLVLKRRLNGSPNEYRLTEKGEYLARVLNEF